MFSLATLVLSLIVSDPMPTAPSPPGSHSLPDAPAVSATAPSTPTAATPPSSEPAAANEAASADSPKPQSPKAPAPEPSKIPPSEATARKNEAAPQSAPAAEKQLLPSGLRDSLRKGVDQHFAAWEELYRDLHQHPELSFEEKRTAAVLAERMRGLGYRVTEGIGGNGIVCVLENGPGPTLLIRTDLDALPVTERTGLAYASKQQVRQADGSLTGVMHACGHDMHMTCWFATAQMLAELREFWKGTLVMIGQPAEERGAGARKMLKDGLFERFPRPDAALALHVDPNLQAGKIGYRSGTSMANVDSVDITVIGRGGHGSAPHTTIDPIVIAARIVMDLQTLVSREINPQDAAVVTVGSIHGGTKHNIIPPEVTMQLTVRSLNDSTRRHLLQGIERIALAAAAAGNAPPPKITSNFGEFTPSLHNDPALTDRFRRSAEASIGAENVVETPVSMGGEDFARYGKEGVPITMFRLGSISPERIKAAEAGEPLPSLHSDRYYPEPAATLRTGVLVMTEAALDLFHSPLEKPAAPPAPAKETEPAATNSPPANSAPEPAPTPDSNPKTVPAPATPAP